MTALLAMAATISLAAQVRPQSAGKLTVGGYGEVAMTRNFYSDNVYRYSSAASHAISTI